MITLNRIEDIMSERIQIDQARATFDRLVQRVADEGDRVVLSTNGKDLAAVVSMQDLALLERAIQVLEDQLDLKLIEQAKAEGGEPLAYDQARRELGLV
jgi:prevent-host-death family protein